MDSPISVSAGSGRRFFCFIAKMHRTVQSLVRMPREKRVIPTVTIPDIRHARTCCGLSTSSKSCPIKDVDGRGGKPCHDDVDRLQPTAVDITGTISLTPSADCFDGKHYETFYLKFKGYIV